jgi:peptidoglycan L-alanyl-D-glutamate endopeptidase CwlK
MSQQLFTDDVLFTQRLLKSAGYYKGVLDGIWGPKTESAQELFDIYHQLTQNDYQKLDTRSEINLHTLHPEAQRLARELEMRFASWSTTTKIYANIKVISGTRSYNEQNQLYRIGRYGDKRPKVTNARGGQSNHNFGIAWDIGIFNNGKYLAESELYIAAGNIGVDLGLEWGGNWKTFKDRPHFQLKTGLSVSEIRSRFEKGERYVG